MSILLVAAFVLPALLYGLAWGAARAEAGSRRARLLPALEAAALAAHAVSLYLATFPAEGFRFGFAAILSAAVWVGVVLLWMEELHGHVGALRLLILPLAMGASLLPLPFPGGQVATAGAGPLFAPHVIVGTLAYAVLLLAALHAGVMTAAERALHAGAAGGGGSVFGRLLEELPPLLVLERILFRFILIGFVLLTLTAGSGIWFSEEVFGRPFRFEHKTLFTVIAWVVFATLLVGRHFRGWRGRVALRLTFAGFSILLLAYAGSRFVLEVLLGRI